MTDTAQEALQEKNETEAVQDAQSIPPPPSKGESILVEPDLDFVRTLKRQGGESFKKCFQCATCSVTCAISPDTRPFPRKEMAWAAWGMKGRLVKDPDIWLCYQCNDCSDRCPRGARPGDVMAAIRRQSVMHYASPRFLGRWVNQPKYLPLLMLIPAALLGLALLVRDPIENILGFSKLAGERIVYSSTSIFPHWLLNSFFISLSFLVLLALIVGGIKFLRAMKAADAQNGNGTPAKEMGPSIVSALKNIITHKDFTLCTKERLRFLSHLCVFYGFIALFVVSLWVMTAKFNPLIQGNFIYPFSFWNPLRIIANTGGAALIAGCLLMIFERLKNSGEAGIGIYFDWLFIGTLLAVAATGFIAEFMHYLRLVPLQYAAYFTHLVLVFMLLVYLPYSKFAHIIYRTIAMIYAEHSGWTREVPSAVADKKQDA